MDGAIWVVLAVVLLAALGSFGAVLAARGALPSGLAVAVPRIRRPEAAGQPASVRAAGQDPAPLAAAQVIDLPVTPAGARRPVEASPASASIGWGDAAAVDDLSRRLSRLDERLEAVERERREDVSRLRRDVATLTETVEATRSLLLAEVAALAPRQEAVLDRLRSDLVAAGGAARPAETDEPRALARRADSAADLYARVARFESALAQVTNPVLLPGEPYAPPAEFLPEALAWENWKDVGERAFALADGYSAQRLFLTDGARIEVAAFVTTLRGVLTRVVYPNLAVDAAGDQLDALRRALVTLAAELPTVRHALEREYRLATGEAPSESPDPS